MAQIAVSGTPSLRSLLPEGGDNFAGLLAGEALTAFAPCYIKSDGLAWLSNGTSANAAAKVDGYAAKACAVGEAVTLLKNIRVRYGSGMTPGVRVYLSATAGTFSDAATTGGTAPIGFVCSADTLFLDISRY